VGQISVQVTATDTGGLFARDVFALTVANVNDAPTVAIPVANQSATEDQEFSFTLPAGTFADADAGDTLFTFAAAANGDPLPAWLSYDPTTLTFTGTPANEDVGSANISVFAVDQSGASVASTFAISVANTNDAPILALPIPDQDVQGGQSFTFQLAPDTFIDVDVGDSFVLSASLSDVTPLPSWIQFNPATGTVSGTAGSQSASYLVSVAATDVAGASGFGLFSLNIEGATNNPPSAVADSVAVNEDATTANLVPALLANDSDPDAGDTIS